MSAKKPRRVRVKGVPGVYRSVSGKYEIAYREDGRLRIHVVEGDLEDAKAARASVVAKMYAGERVAPTRVTLAEYAETWFETLGGLRPRTREAYEGSMRRYVIPRLGSKRLTAVTPDDLASLVTSMRAAGYSEWTIAGTLTPLSAMFGKAVRAGSLATNPVRALEKSERAKPGSSDRRILSEKEIARLIAAGGRFRPLIGLAIFTGVRLGEALGLRWEDVDFKAGVIHVRRQLGRDRTCSDLKTSRARRNVVLVPELATLLKKHRLASPYKGPHDFVFPAPDGRGRHHRSTSRAVERACERAKLEDVSFHTLRHTFASWLISGAKQDVETVSRQLGHANATITLRIYSHEFEAERNTDALRLKMSETLGRHLRAVND